MPEEHNEHRDEAATRDLVVVRPFTMTMDDGEKLAFGVGTHKNVPAHVADHWYAQAHAAKPGEEPPSPLAMAPQSDRDRIALRNAEEEVQRISAIAQRATDENAAAQLEFAQLRERVAELEAERDGLRGQLSDRSGSSDDAEEDEPTTDDVRVHRKGRRWYVSKGGEQVGEYGSKEAADARAAELRGAGT